MSKLMEKIKEWNQMRQFKKNMLKEFIKVLILGVLIYVPGIILTFGFFKDTSNINENFLKVVVAYLHNLIIGNSIGAAGLSIISSIIISIVIIIFTCNKEEKTVYSESEINSVFENYARDAEELIVCGGDLSFLKTSIKQKNIIKKLTKRATILAQFDKDLVSVDLKNIYKELEKSKVKFYNNRVENSFSSRGQIKKNKSGVYSALFTVKNENGTYNKIKIDDQHIIKILKSAIEKEGKESRNALISIVLLDLGGVYFTGDYYKDFLEKVERYLNVSIKRENNEKILLDEDLNLGKIDIIEYIEKNINEKLNREQKIEIKKIWSSVWKPNPEMEKIVKKLKDNKIKVYPCSNLDRENGLIYIERGDFKDFGDIRFFSYEMKKVKTKKEFFEDILKTLKEKNENLCPFEVILIDDQNVNINMSKTVGIDGIFYRNPAELESELRNKRLII